MKHSSVQVKMLPAFLFMFSCCCIACSSSRYYIQPADEHNAPKDVAVLKVSSRVKISVDDNDVTGYGLIYMMPGWHHISFGWQQNKGCAKWQYIKHYYRGPGGSRIPVSPYPSDSSRCIKKKLEYVHFSGWWEFPAGQNIRWDAIREKLKTEKSRRDEVDNLADTYKNGNTEARLIAVKRLGDIQNVRVIYILIKALKDSEDSIKIAACMGLKKIDNQYAVPFIKELRAGTKSYSVKSAANSALKSLTGYDIYY